jgi:alkaline phosphatase D
MEFTRWPIPLNLDAWDGYPKNRERVLDIFRGVGGNVLVLTGDSHAAWANELKIGEARAAVELGTTSITSPGIGDLFARAGVDFAAGLRARNAHVKWTDQVRRGYLRLTLDRRRATAEFMAVSTVTSKDFVVTRDAAFEIFSDPRPGLGPITPVVEKQKKR